MAYLLKKKKKRKDISYHYLGREKTWWYETQNINNENGTEKHYTLLSQELWFLSWYDDSLCFDLLSFNTKSCYEGKFSFLYSFSLTNFQQSGILFNTLCVRNSHFRDDSVSIKAAAVLHNFTY